MNRPPLIDVVDQNRYDYGVHNLDEEKIQCDAREAAPTPTPSSGSPLSVIEIFQDQELTKSPVHKIKRRGIDSPVKAVDTRNVYVSAISSKKSKSTSVSSSISTSGSSSLETYLENLPAATVPNTIPNTNTAAAPPGPPSLPPLDACHRRQNTCDSTHSKVAAVARGASKAAAEEASDWIDKPVACPRRQQSVGRDSVSTTANDVTAKPTGRIPRPPRHDLMKKTLKLLEDTTPSSPMDRLVPCPTRQLTAEQSLPSTQREVCVTPESLLHKFDRQKSAASADSRDDDTSSSFALDKEEPYFQVTPTPHPTLHTTTTPAAIQAWLNMPQEASRWANSEPTLKVSSTRDLIVAPQTPQHPQGSAVMGDESERTFGEGSVLLNTPMTTTEEDDTTANDTACDDRMFQAFLNMPPRVCTTHDVPLYHTTTQSTPHRCFSGTDTPTNRQIHMTEFCLDVSAIEMSIDLSLPSFFSDCRGLSGISDIILPKAGSADIKPSAAPSPLPEGSMSSRMSLLSIPSLMTPGRRMQEGGGASSGSLSLAELAAKADRQRRVSLPPPMPHRRKPSLHVDYDDNVVEDDEENKTIQALWSSMPVLHSSPKEATNNNNNKSGGLRSSWPRMRADTAESAPPSIPTRFRRQDSLLSTEADCETMVPTSATANVTNPAPENTPNRPRNSNLSPTRRSSMPPLQPHRRKPSLHLEDIMAAEQLQQQRQPHDNQDYVTQQHNLWSSLPAVLLASGPPNSKRRSSSVLPPAMPHRRKPSLNILEDGEEGMIEMWLSSHNRLPLTSCTASPGGSVSRCNNHRRQDSFGGNSSAGASIVLKQVGEVVESAASVASVSRPNHHRRQESFGGGSVCSIILKEGEAEI